VTIFAHWLKNITSLAEAVTKNTEFQQIFN